MNMILLGAATAFLPALAIFIALHGDRHARNHAWRDIAAIRRRMWEERRAELEAQAGRCPHCLRSNGDSRTR